MASASEKKLDDGERARLLRIAASMIQRVTGSLNTNAHRCRECGLTVREDFFEKQARDQLRAAASKCRRWAEDFQAEADDHHKEAGAKTPA